MADVFWAIIIIWVGFRIYSSFAGSSNTNNRTFFYQNNQQNHYNSQREGEAHVDPKAQHDERKPNSDKGGEYVDFEEVKD